MTLERESRCKVNLLLNILGKRPDGFHELETVMHPVDVFDLLSFTRKPAGIELTCSDPRLPVDSANLVHRAAAAFLEAARIAEGVRIHLEKRIPLAAGLGGGSGNAAVTLSGLNELFGHPLAAARLSELAATLGSDVPFFLQSSPALGTDRGQLIQPLEHFPALAGSAFILVHPGFGVSTAWAYGHLAHFPAALNGRRGRAAELISQLQASQLNGGITAFYNSLEAPVLHKYPILGIYQEFLRREGAAAALMSGSGSTTFGVVPEKETGLELAEKFKSKFGNAAWVTVVPVSESHPAKAGR